jgi:hypothetical protein
VAILLSYGTVRVHLAHCRNLYYMEIGMARMVSYMDKR